MTITELCEELRNWFEVKRMFGTFTISDGSIDLSDYLLDGQYYRIKDSVFNNGVHKYGDEIDTLKDETFKGEIWALAIPQTFLDLMEEINKWVDKYGEAVNSPFSSESFGGYAVTYKSAGEYSDSGGNGWQSVFASRLNKWRKI